MIDVLRELFPDPARIFIRSHRGNTWEVSVWSEVNPERYLIAFGATIEEAIADAVRLKLAGVESKGHSSFRWPPEDTLTEEELL